MKKRKVLIPIFFILLFFVIFGISFFIWKTGWEHSSADTTTASVTAPRNCTNGSNKINDTDLITVNTTFYNYRYDREMYDKARDQGAQSCYDGGIIPFGTFDKALSSYYDTNNVKAGIYAGNFYMYYGGLEGVGNKKIDFPGYYYFRWAANIANRHSPYNSVCKGIVANKLSDSGALMSEKNTGSDKVAMPYFNKTFLTDNKGNGVSIGAVKENVGFPFRKITSGSKKGYYEFDSTKDVVRFHNMGHDNPTYDTYYFGKVTTENGKTIPSGTLDYYHNTDFVFSKASSSPQFLPYNEANGDSFPSGETGLSDRQKKLDYGFGIRFDIPFFLSSDGKVDGKNMVFEFSGDDDVWIFLDNKLVLDLGGQHGKATGTIDFGVEGDKIRVTNQTVTYVKGNSDSASTLTSDKILAEDTEVKSESNIIDGIVKGNEQSKKHVLTIFYMERGMFESNLHMAFNFVPGAEPPVTPEPVTPKPATPEPVVPPGDPTPTPAENSLTIQNEMVFPTDKDGKDKINGKFLEKVKNFAEDDVFQYSIENWGTENKTNKTNEVKYPSGKLTVRENGNKRSYLSFGAKPYIWVYFISPTKDIKSTDANQSKQWLITDTPYITGDFNNWQIKAMENYSNKVYRFKLPVNSIFQFTNNQGNRTCKTNDITANGKYNGWGFTISAVGDSGILTCDYPNPGINATPPYETFASLEYSSELPYQEAGTDETAYCFNPTTSSKFLPVSNTAYEIKEKYCAPVDGSDGPIKINSELTSGITTTPDPVSKDGGGLFDLFYNDSATFKKQFDTGSLMKVVQQDKLREPKRQNDNMPSNDAEKANASDKVTLFQDRTTERKTADYYYPKFSAQNKNPEDVKVSYDGQYCFKNVDDTEGDVKITQVFTNTIKTGSLIISKELKGNMDADSAHSYKFQVSFSNTFGDTTDTTTTQYDGSYTLVDKDGNKSSRDATTGIVLQPRQKAIITGIPVGTKYTITEVDTNDDSVVSDIQTSYVATADDDTITSPKYHEDKNVTGGDSNIEDLNKTTKTITGTIPCSIVDKLYDSETNLYSEVEVSVKFTNQLGSLTITKQISGDVNNVSYYKSNHPKTYTFIVTDGTNPYVGQYVVYTYTYTNANTEPIVKKDTKTLAAENEGKIVLNEGQKAEIGGISLTTNKKYTIKEEVDGKDIYFVEDVKVTSGTKTKNTLTDESNAEYGLVIKDNTTNKTYNISTYNTSITTQEFSASNPTFDVIFNNRYTNTYLTIEKLVDKKYYDGKSYGDKTYQDLTKAKQSFLFTVKQYKTLAEAEAGTTDPESSFEIVLTIGQDNDKEYENKADADKEVIGSTTDHYTYKLSKTVKVLANRYYRIEEDTNWSWKYLLNKVAIDDKIPNPTDPKSTAINTDTEKYVILKTYLDEFHELEQKKNADHVPIAKFYNLLDPAKTDIDGDTDSIPNIIKIDK